MKSFKDLLAFLYGTEAAPDIYRKLLDILAAGGKAAKAGIPALQNPEGGPFTHRDALLISYGNMLSAAESGIPGANGESGLSRLGKFLSQYNKGTFSFLHILPFHPYSSDDGFSVIDYRAVDPRFGSWDDIGALKKDLGLVFDFVINHGSVQNAWFRGFLEDSETYRTWYLTRPGDYDSTTVVRPRTLPLLTPFTIKPASGGEITRYVWTTFSADQADYDFSNPQVLLEFITILLEYAARGAGIVRLDAIAYLWKEDGTPCLHHPKTHAVVKLFRAVIDYLELPLLLLTETNVPHEENISYFGKALGEPAVDSLPEAHMVYNFALPPLTLHAALSGDAGPLRNWARTLPGPASGQFFLNFLASHDGVGLTPARGLVDENAFAATLEEARRRGALISYKSTPSGDIPYELNCSYVSVIAPAELGDPALRARAFLAAQAVLLSLSGLPALYFHSWMGSEAWKEGPELLGYNRAINREKPPLDRVQKELEDPRSLRYHIYRGIQKLAAFRQSESAFGPLAEQRVLEAEGGFFVLLRIPRSGGRRVLCIENLGAQRITWKAADKNAGAACDNDIPPEYAELTLEPWETRWIAFGKAGGGARIVSTLGQR